MFVLHLTCQLLRKTCVQAFFPSGLLSSICSTRCAWHPVASCDLASNLLHSVAPRILNGTACLVMLALSPIPPTGSDVDWRCLRSMCHAWLWVLCCDACSGLQWSAALAEFVALLTVPLRLLGHSYGTCADDCSGGGQVYVLEDGRLGCHAQHSLFVWKTLVLSPGTVLCRSHNQA
jgi:hypothetical protein